MIKYIIRKIHRHPILESYTLIFLLNTSIFYAHLRFPRNYTKSLPLKNYRHAWTPWPPTPTPSNHHLYIRARHIPFLMKWLIKKSRINVWEFWSTQKVQINRSVEIDQKHSWTMIHLINTPSFKYLRRFRVYGRSRDQFLLMELSRCEPSNQNSHHECSPTDNRFVRNYSWL